MELFFLPNWYFPTMTFYSRNRVLFCFFKSTNLSKIILVVNICIYDTYIYNTYVFYCGNIHSIFINIKFTILTIF